jgi:hypothetical protein
MASQKAKTKVVVVVVDVSIRYEGSNIVLFTLETQEAKDFVQDNVQTESWMFLGRSLVVDAHYADQLIDGMSEAGLNIACDGMEQ